MYPELLQYYLEQRRWTNLPAGEVRRRQTVKFRRLFEYAREHSPFYRSLYLDAGVDKLEIRTFSDIQKVPVIDKAMMRKCPHEEIMTRPVTPDLVMHTTSGSTGEPFKVYQSRFEEFTAHVRVFGVMRAVGYHPAKRIAMLTRMEPDAVLDVENDLRALHRLQRWLGLFRRENLSIYSPPEDIARRLARGDIDIFWSTPSMLSMVCDSMERCGIRAHIPWSVLYSETLTEPLCARVRRCLGGSIINLYGAMECPTISFDVNGGGMQRVFSNAVLVSLENVGRDGDAAAGEAVITNLVNRTMPFIRYNLHDSVTVPDAPDAPVKVIGSVRGRTNDQLDLPNGGVLTYPCASAMFREFPESLQYQFVQRKSGSIALRLRARDDISASVVRERALARWRSRYPDEPLEVELVDAIPVDPATWKHKVLKRLSDDEERTLTA